VNTTLKVYSTILIQAKMRHLELKSETRSRKLIITLDRVVISLFWKREFLIPSANLKEKILLRNQMSQVQVNTLRRATSREKLISTKVLASPKESHYMRRRMFQALAIIN